MTKINKKNQNGFTLIELLIVVAIIAILALIVMLALNPVEMSRKSRDSRRLSDIATIRKAIDLTMADNSGTLPTVAAYTDIAGWTVSNFGGAGTFDISKYLSSLPKDPANDGSTDTLQVITTGCGTSTTPQKNQMVYEFKSVSGGTYVLRARLESTDNCLAIANDGNANGYYETGTLVSSSW